MRSSGCSLHRELVEPRRVPVFGAHLQCQLELFRRRGVPTRRIEHISKEEVVVTGGIVEIHVCGERLQVLIEVCRPSVQIAQVHLLFTLVWHTVHPSAYCVDGVLIIPDGKMGQPEMKLGYAVLRRRQHGLQERLHGKGIRALFEVSFAGRQAVTGWLLAIYPGLIVPAGEMPRIMDRRVVHHGRAAIMTRIRVGAAAVVTAVNSSQSMMKRPAVASPKMSKARVMTAEESAMMPTVEAAVTPSV